ncbi:MAG: sensor histidine kinase [Cytophagales bacterium]|nr:sensor histidine kinase [Cytophagales bacterium]
MPKPDNTRMKILVVEDERELAEILPDNLLGNAIKHNLSGGPLAVRLTHELLTIRNAGKRPADRRRPF